MDLVLPKRIDNTEPPVLRNVKHITIIGANGAGKTRFRDKIMEDCGDKAFRLSALNALYSECSKRKMKGSIDALYDEYSEGSRFLRLDADTEFEKLIYILLHDEFLEMMHHKTTVIEKGSCDFTETKLDKSVRIWEEIFPGNKILRESGRLLFSTERCSQPYLPVKLSDGEKAVFYYIGSILYAMPDSIIFISDPGIFLHPSLMKSLWNRVERMRPDCTFVYNTHDINFVTSRVDNRCIWVKKSDIDNNAWDYEILSDNQNLSDELYMDLLGSRKPVLFIEGDNIHSIDYKLYPLIFTDFNVKPLGSCNKVIESTRTFNDLKGFHQLDSYGLVDRDRRDDKEVEYLRRKKIFVPEVAEVENILMLEGVIKAVAKSKNKDPEYVFNNVSKNLITMFRQEMKKQVLEHVRHRVKKSVEFLIDRRFTNITSLENHMVDLVKEINPRGMYQRLFSDFNYYLDTRDYNKILKVFNDKMILIDTHVAEYCGLQDKDEYITRVLKILKDEREGADTIREAVKSSLLIDVLPTTQEATNNDEENEDNNNDNNNENI